MLTTTCLEVIATNRSDLVQALAMDGYPEPEQAVNRVLDVIGASLACGESVSIRNFGKFEARKRSAVVRKNPKTGVEIKVPEKISVGFIPAPALKQRLNRNNSQ
jgi:nucleoid DNA-binding protein